jgi:hypothetical protein
VLYWQGHNSNRRFDLFFADLVNPRVFRLVFDS